MLRYIFKKEHRIQSLLYQYLDALKMIRENFTDAMETILADGNADDVDFLIQRTHKFESKADDIRDEINGLMYGKALIPESRGDIMELLSALETIPNRLERILRNIQIQKLVIPETIRPDIADLVRISMDCIDTLCSQMAAMIEGKKGIRTMLTTIDTNESHCDHLQRRMMIKVFDSDVEPVERLQLKEIIENLGEISDRAHWIARMVNIFSLKRRI